MRQVVNGVLFVFPGSLVLLGLLGGPFFSQATGGYLVGGILLVVVATLGVAFGIYCIVKGLAAKLTQ